MAKKTELYPATIMENGALTEILVDVFNLPYDRFDDENPLILHSDVSLGRAKGRSIPNMRNVIIMGTLNLGEFKIQSDTVLPDEVTELICEHSINSLDDLSRKLPAVLNRIKIRHALFNNIKKDKDGALSAARRFMQLHPRIVVTDGSLILRDVLKDIDSKNIQQNEIADVPIATKDVVTSNIKTDEYYSTDEVLVVCKNAVPEFASLSDSELARYIKLARSARANLKISPVELKRADGAKLVCVHRSHINTIIEFIKMQINEDKERASKVKEHVRKPKAVPVAPVVQPGGSTERLYELDGRKLNITKIRKYIHKREWNLIKSDCGNNKKQLLDILNEVHRINVKPTDTNGSKVYYIEDGKIKVSRVMELKNSKCVTQGVGTLNSRQRIIWGMCGDVFVCVGFFAEHEHFLCKYKNVIRNLDMADVNLSECYDVVNLIDELSGGHGGPSGPEVVGDSDVLDTMESHEGFATTPNEPADVVDKVADIPVVDDESVAKAVEENKTSAKPSNEVTPTGVVWAELYSLNIRLTQQINLLDGERNIILKQMQSENNTDKLMALTCGMAHNLERRKELEEMLVALHEMNKKLIGWQSNLDKQK